MAKIPYNLKNTLLTPKGDTYLKIKYIILNPNIIEFCYKTHPTDISFRVKYYLV